MTRVAPDLLWFHILSWHKLHPKSTPSRPAPQLSTRATAVPPPVQPNPAEHPTMPTHGPDPYFWQFIEKLKGEYWVICPCPLDPRSSHTPSNCRVKPQNLAKHMRKVHKVDLTSAQYKRRQCKGCKLPVPPAELAAHIKCQKPTSPPSNLPTYLGPRLALDPEWTSWIKRVQLKRKASTHV